MISAQPKGWREALAFYTQRRLLIIFLFGVASGYPWLMIGSSMSAWLNEIGINRTSIGYFGAVFAAYSVNFLWSPLIDRVRLPFMHKWLGQRRSWILLCQLGIAFGCFHLASVDLAEGLRYAAMVALFIAVCSATQDIGIDAYRIDSIGENEARVQSAAAAMATAGWWTGYGAIGAIPFFLSDLPGWDWPLIYQGMAAFMLVLTVGVWLAREPQTARRALQLESEHKYQRIARARPGKTLALTLLSAVFITSALLAWNFLPGVLSAISAWALWQLVLLTLIIRLLVQLHLEQAPAGEPLSDSADNTAATAIKRSHRMIAWIMVTMIEPIYEFFNRNGVRMALTVLLFITLFKVGEAFLGRMSIVFYQEIGFTNTDIAIFSKLMNWWVTILFALIGSYVNMRLGIIKGLIIGGSAMALSNLLFAGLAVVGPDKSLFVIAVISDGFTSAWSTVAFVAFISLLANRAFTATQYALMASLGTLGRTLLGTYSGAMVDWLDGNWALFFLLTTVMVIPSLLLLWTIRHRIYALENENNQRQATADFERDEAAAAKRNEQ
ncbi:AmpG family muropeptide MFS transporter [Aliidiomarina soli]|uniref:MFS transporter n=1 Tax=Aliidiomarina soli TaxID=1928574 RepID=A0A432WH06_9GAMM|nr:MFS transporter [Aliidiomarina soli]RUO32987.1 MFS transporter [Aliidiomarina soli]